MSARRDIGGPTYCDLRSIRTWASHLNADRGVPISPPTNLNEVIERFEPRAGEPPRRSSAESHAQPTDPHQASAHCRELSRLPTRLAAEAWASTRGIPCIWRSRSVPRRHQPGHSYPTSNERRRSPCSHRLRRGRHFWPAAGALALATTYDKSVADLRSAGPEAALAAIPSR